MVGRDLRCCLRFCNGGGGTNQNIRVAANVVACDLGFNFWQVGTVTRWYPVAGFRLAVDVEYTRIETAFDGQTVSLGKTQGLRPTGNYLAKDQGILAVTFNAQSASRISFDAK